MGSKRPFNISALSEKRAKMEEVASSSQPDASKQNSGAATHQPVFSGFMTTPVEPQKALYIFLVQSRTEARRLAKSKGMELPVNKPFVEIEARIGTIQSPFGANDMRALPSGPKKINLGQGKVGIANAFLCNGAEAPARGNFVGGITRSHFTRWTGGGISEAGPISSAFGVNDAGNVKKELVEVEMVETVFGGYPNHQRVCFPGEFVAGAGKEGKVEKKQKLSSMDIALPSANYDLRLQLATEIVTASNVKEVPAQWTSRRLKRRRSYCRRDKRFAWRLDVTEVTTVAENANQGGGHGDDDGITFEVEVELSATNTLKLVNCAEGDVDKLCKELSKQLWWMWGQINPLSDVLEVDSFLRPHPDANAVKFSLAQLFALKKFRESKQFSPAIPAQSLQPPKLHKFNFIGCMPVNFSRHNIEEVQRGSNGYYLSEKTDGVRYLMVFTDTTVVLMDRAQKGYQPTPVANGTSEPFAPILPLILPGTVLDGEVVVHRELRRPIFIVFDILCSGTNPVMNLPFEERLNHLRRATFRTPTANKDMFCNTFIKNTAIACPLVRKNFIRRTELSTLLGKVVEERGARTYRNGEPHNHCTDGIIFQPNKPYVCGTDVGLLKWKYLDTVTIDVEILPPRRDDELRVGVLGDDGNMVDMSRYVRLPKSELLRLQADRVETGAKIAEVGFDPETGEWYYMTMRPDKIASNHISTVLGTLLELAESLGTNELCYRMSVRDGGRDTYRKDIRGMQKQLLDYQRKTMAKK